MSEPGSMREAFEEAKKGMAEMETLIKKGIGQDNVSPFSEFVGGGYEQAIEYAEVDRAKYKAEVGKRDGNYIFHFWPRSRDTLAIFNDKLGDAMLAVFKHPERIAAKHDEVWRCFDGEERKDRDTTPLCRFWGDKKDFESGHCPNCNSTNVDVSMSSWAVKVSGFADNPLADELAAKVFDELDKLL